MTDRFWEIPERSTAARMLLSILTTRTLPYGNSDYDQRQRFVASLVWAPTVKSDNRAVRDGLNGFTFSTIVTVGSPFPVNALMSSTFSPCAAVVLPTTTCAAGRTGIDGGVTGGVEQNASNAAGRIPISEKNSFRGATQVRTVDFRIGRDIPLFREGYKLQFFIEAFNLFNHRIITSVNGPAYTYVQGNTATITGLPGASCLSANPCLAPVSSFLTPTATSNSLVGARQLQISGKFFF